MSPTSLPTAPSPRSPLGRSLVTVAAVALGGLTAAPPAAASDEWGGGDGGSTATSSWNGGGDGRQERGRHRGVVTADRLALRTSPARDSEVVRYARRGEVVPLYCKSPGDRAGGNPPGYLLTDGTWAWGAARCIDDIGAAPRWC